MEPNNLRQRVTDVLPSVRRDLEALSTAGIPVYPQPGRGGGWSLVGGARTDLTGLTASEAQALFLLVGSSSDPQPESAAATNATTNIPLPKRREPVTPESSID